MFNIAHVLPGLELLQPRSFNRDPEDEWDIKLVIISQMTPLHPTIVAFPAFRSLQ